MKAIFADLVSRAFSLLAGLATPHFQKILERWATSIEDDVPRIGSTWVVHFRNPGTRRTARPALIDAHLHQFGRRVSGIGFIQGEPAIPFRYEGVIRRNVFYGTFKRKDSHVLTGTGTFVLKIAADSSRMAGRCTWYESRIDDVWSSGYVWVQHGQAG